MKHLWISLSILAALIVLLLVSIFSLGRLIPPLVDQLEQTAQLVQEARWEEARTLLGRAADTWEEKGDYLHLLMEHQDMDQVLLLFQEADRYLAAQMPGQFAAVNARLVTQLELLQEMEQLTWRNIL